MIDAKKTIEKLKGETEKERYSVYFSKAVYDEFKNHCGAFSASRVLEELMREFIVSSKAHPKSSIKKTSKNSKKS